MNIADPQEILRTLQVIVEPGSITELRALDTPRRTVSGYYDDLALMAQHAISVTEAPAVYFTLNPVAPSLLARANNRIQPWAKYTTADSDIERRRWLLLDFDPIRPAGISATNDEHAAALERTDHCRDYLQGQGWPDPVQADSGNGAHLLYRIELPNDKASESLLRRVLQALAARFDDDQVEVDRNVYNAARITKLYGTYARKGDPTHERPHRKASILWNGHATFEVVALAQLEILANANAPVTTPPAKVTVGKNVLGLLTQWGLTVVRSEDHQGQEQTGRKHVLAACPFDITHEDSCIFEFPTVSPVFKCFHTSCSDYGWKELRAKFETVDSDHRQCEIITGANGQPKPLLTNAIATIRNSPEWANVLALDEFALVTIPQRPAPWPQSATGCPWSDFDDSMTAAWLQQRGVYVNSKTAAEAVAVISQQNCYHPVRNYLNGLVWDGKPRLNGWLHDYLGVPDSPYVRSVGGYWLISAIARVFRPGCQADCLLLLLGPQGTRKSTALRTLAGDAWFTDHISDLNSKDARGDLRGVWVCEMSELAAIRRAEVERVKAFELPR